MKKQIIPAKWLTSIALFLFLCLIPICSAHAQDNVTGSFGGEVKDSVTGTGIPGATVRIMHQDTGVPIAKLTDANGRFHQGQLPPGDYVITFSRQGYVTQSQQWSITAMKPTVLIPPLPLVAKTTVVAPDTTAAATPTPQAGATPVQSTEPTTGQPATPAETVVATEANIRGEINTIDAQRGGTYSRQKVSTLPLGSTTLTRTFDELGLLLPGVAPAPQTLGTVAGPGVGAGVGSAGQFTVNGLRSRANNFTVDGSDNNDEDIGVRRQGFLALVPQPIESVQEYQVITLLAPAQYGRNFGAQVNAVSRSGGNQTHGMIYGLINSSQLNARNPFDYVGPNTTIPLQGRVLNADRQTLGAFRNVFVNGVQRFETNRAGAEDSFTLGQGGFVLGGPLVPSVDETGAPRSTGRSLFYFISAEGHLLNANKEESFAVPTVEERGVFRTGATGLFFDPLNPADAAVAFPTTVPGDAIFSFFPFPNNPNGVYGRNTFTTVLPASGQGKILSGKVNANFSIFNKPQEFVTRYNFTDDWRDIPVTGGALFSTLRPRVRTQNFSTFLNTNLSGLNSANPVLNQFRASYGRTRLIFDEVRDTSFLIPSEFARTLQPGEQQFLLNAQTLFNVTLPGNTAVRYLTAPSTERTLNQFGSNALAPLGQLNVAGYSPVGVDVFNFPQSRVNNTYQLADTVSTQFGSHSVAFGADLRRTELNSELPRNARPLLTFNAFPNFASILGLGGIPGRPFFTGTDLASASAPSGAFQALSVGNDSKINLRYYQLDFFGQDQWRIRGNLSLSFGLRYEYNTVPKSANNKIEGTFGATLPASISDLRQFIAGRTEIFDADKNNFAPRFSIAYSPQIFRDRTTVIRAGAGVFYDQILGAVVSQSRNVFPTFLNTNFAGGLPTGTDFNIFTPNLAFITCPGFTSPVPLVQPGTLNRLNPQVPLNCFTNITQSLFPSGFPSTLPAKTLNTPGAYQYGLTLEQQLSDGLVFSAAYVGTRGRHLLRQTTPNQGQNAIVVITDVVPTLQPTATGFVRDPLGRSLPKIGGVTIFTADANSRYDALQLQLRGRYNLLGATNFQVNYTYGKATDDVSDVFDLAGAPALPQNSLTFAGERAAANFDVRHRVSSNYITDLSSWGKNNSFLHAIFNALEVAGTGTFQTGQPFTVNSIFDVNLDGNLTDRLDNTSGITLADDRAQPLRLTGNPISMLANLGQDGKVPRNSFRSSNLWVTNAAVVKTVRFSESTRLIFRTDVFNVFNRANYGIPVRYLESPGFGRATDTVTPGRRIQFGLKLAF
ncbi:MAG: TonB-dependent receptor [Acidobacteriota bacterium]